MFDKFIDFKLLQLLNAYSKLVTDEIFKYEISKELKYCIFDNNCVMSDIS